MKELINTPLKEVQVVNIQTTDVDCLFNQSQSRTVIARVAPDKLVRLLCFNERGQLQFRSATGSSFGAHSKVYDTVRLAVVEALAVGDSVFIFDSPLEFYREAAKQGWN